MTISFPTDLVSSTLFDKDMIAVPISAELRMAVGGAPSYFEKHQKPRAPHDLTRHDCINIRSLTLGGNYIWEFEKGGKEAKVHVHGPLTFNASRLVVEAALAGNGLTFTLEDRVRAQINSGKLIRVPADWCQPFDGFFFYYLSPRHVTPAFKLLVETVESQGLSEVELVVDDLLKRSAERGRVRGLIGERRQFAQRPAQKTTQHLVASDSVGLTAIMYHSIERGLLSFPASGP